MILNGQITPLIGRDYFRSLFGYLKNCNLSLYATFYEFSFDVPGYFNSSYSLLHEIQRLGHSITDSKIIFNSTLQSSKKQYKITKIIENLKDTNLNFVIAPFGQLLHSKILVLDHEFCFVGSHNFSSRSLSSNLESSVLVRSEGLAKYFENYISSLYNTFIDGGLTSG